MNPLNRSPLTSDQSHFAVLNVGYAVRNNVKNAKRIDSDDNLTNGSVVRNTVLRSTLLGEYASLLLMCHSLFGVVYWVAFILQNPAALIMVAAGLWIAFRAVGGFAGEKWAAGVSALMLIMPSILVSTGVAQVPAWLSGSVVAPIVWTVILGLLLVVEFFDCRKRSHARLCLLNRRMSDGRSLKLAFAGLFLAWGLGVPTVTLIHQISRPPLGKAQLEEMSFIEHAGFRCGEALVTACFFALGCNIGSFLNVVVWRMPLGKSIVYEKSRCPACSTAIEGKDNIPIFGWLSLGGQCRACGTEIAPRYPIVEGITGSIFLVLYFVELISGGANLPVRPINQYRGVLWIIMYAKWDLIGLYLFHCFLFSSLLVFTMISIDGNRIPRRLLVFCFGVAIIAPILVANLTLIPVLPSSMFAVSTIFGRVVHEIAGAVTGTMAGAIIIRLIKNSSVSTGLQTTLVPAMSLIGIVLGWQAVLAIANMFGLVCALRHLGRLSPAILYRWPVAVDLLIVTILHHLVWRIEWRYLSFS